MTEEQTIEQKTASNQEQQAQTPAQTPEVQPTDDDRNWKAFREERKKERDELQMAKQEADKRTKEAQALKIAMDSLLDKPQNTVHHEYDDDHDSEEKRIQREVEKILSAREKKTAAATEERQKNEIPVRLRQEFSDFDKVVTTENLDYLQFKYPEVANGYQNSPDGYLKWKNLYAAVKRFVPAATQDPTKAESNLNKPRSMASGVAQTGDSAPVMVDDKRKSDNWQRMQKIMRGA